MVRLSKKTEYALLALQYIGTHRNNVVSAKEISNKMNIPFDYLSKTMQILMKNGIVNSKQGKAGGYSLAKTSDEISIADVIQAIEEKNAMAIVECFEKPQKTSCDRLEICTIRNPLKELQSNIEKMLNTTKLSEMIDKK